MATAITIEYDGTEQSLEAWGITLDSVVQNETNLRSGTLTFIIAGVTLASAPVFAFEGKIILRVNRTGSGTSWTGGTVHFIGYRLAFNISVQPVSEGVRYDFANAWYFCETTLYQQPRASRANSSATLDYPLTTALTLFWDLDGSYAAQILDNGEQIAAALQFILDYPPDADATPFILGTIDPAVEVPSFACAELTVAAVVEKCLQLSPDCTVFFDYTTTSGGSPRPTLHVRARANLTPVSLAIKNGTDHKSLQITPREDLVPRAVLIYFKATSRYNGGSFIQYTRQKYGPHGSNSASDPDAGPRVLIQTLEMIGSSFEQTSNEITTRACDANHGTAATKRAWWALHVPELADATRVTDVTIGAPTFTDDDGSTISSPLGSYPNELIDGGLTDWMVLADDVTAADGVTVTISAEASYTINTKASTSGALLPTEKQVKKMIHTRVTLTNASTGVYTSTNSYPAEDIPAGLAQKIYEALETLHYQGEHVLQEDYPTNQVTMASTLHLTGGHTDWTTMAASIQSITKNFGFGATTIRFGPPTHLSAGDLLAIFRFNAWRRVWYPPGQIEDAEA